MHHVGLYALPMVHWWSFLAYTPNWPVALILLLLHLELYLLTFDCANCENILTFKRHLKTHNLVFLCCINRLCIFGPKGAIQIRYYYIFLNHYYYYYYYNRDVISCDNVIRMILSLAIVFCQNNKCNNMTTRRRQTTDGPMSSMLRNIEFSADQHIETGLSQVTMVDEAAAQRACKDPNPIIDGRKANVNLAYLGAKPRLPVGDILCRC